MAWLFRPRRAKEAEQRSVIAALREENARLAAANTELRRRSFLTSPRASAEEAPSTNPLASSSASSPAHLHAPSSQYGTHPHVLAEAVAASAPRIRKWDAERVPFMPLALELADADASVPRVTYEAILDALGAEGAPPVSLFLEGAADNDATEDETEGEDDDGGSGTRPRAPRLAAPDIFCTSSALVWANDASLAFWGDTLEQRLKYQKRRGLKFGRAGNTTKSYLKYECQFSGGAPPSKADAVHALVEWKGRVRYGYLVEDSARCVLQEVYRAHATYKYTQSAACIFTPNGEIVQSNPIAMAWGIWGEDAKGRPVNGLRFLFGNQRESYYKMWHGVNNKETYNMWHGRIKVQTRRPRSASGGGFGRDGADDVGSDDDDHDIDDAHAHPHAASFLWANTFAHKFRDPATGKEVIYMELVDITRQVEQEELIKEAKKREHAILKEIIPEHIIDFLLEEKRNAGDSLQSLASPSCAASWGRASSSGSEIFLTLQSVRQTSERRVASLAEHHSSVTVLFTDIVGFTKMTSQCAPTDIMLMLNQLFTMFDLCAQVNVVYKVETIGDSYMCASGLDLKSEKERLSVESSESHDAPASHAERMLYFAREILEGVQDFTTPSGEPLQIRVGMHTGDCMSGVVGLKMPRFCLFGDTVNMASRMESTGVPGRVHASKATRDLLPDEPWEATGGVEAKGKGMMETFLSVPE